MQANGQQIGHPVRHVCDETAYLRSFSHFNVSCHHFPKQKNFSNLKTLLRTQVEASLLLEGKRHHPNRHCKAVIIVYYHN